MTAVVYIPAADLGADIGLQLWNIDGTFTQSVVVPVLGAAAVHFKVIAAALGAVAVLVVIMNAYVAVGMLAVHDPEVLSVGLHVLGAAPRRMLRLIEMIVVNIGAVTEASFKTGT